MSRTPTAVVDTDVFSCLFVRQDSNDPRVSGWRELLRGRRVLISFQTRAELLSGAFDAGWGVRSLTRLRGLIESTPTIRADDEVTEAYARLTASCRRAGHPLHQKIHVGDRWVGACAMAKDIELLAGDGIFIGAPEIALLS